MKYSEEYENLIRYNKDEGLPANPDHASHIAYIAENPKDRLSSLVFADKLEESDDPAHNALGHIIRGSTEQYISEMERYPTTAKYFAPKIENVVGSPKSPEGVPHIESSLIESPHTYATLTLNYPVPNSYNEESDTHKTLSYMHFSPTRHILSLLDKLHQHPNAKETVQDLSTAIFEHDE